MSPCLFDLCFGRTLTLVYSLECMHDGGIIYFYYKHLTLMYME